MTSTNSTPLPKADAKYDVIKFFLSLMVLAIHSSLYPMVLYPWLRMAVPLFFIMSAYFVFSKLHGATAAEQKAILKAFVIRNLKLYVCWFLILLPITFYLRRELYLSKDILGNVINLIRSILFSSTFIASWFIMATVIDVLVIFWLTKVLRKGYIVFLISLVAFCIVTLASSYTSVLGTFWLTCFNKYKDIFGGFLYNSFPAALFWVFIGKLFAEQKIKCTSWGLWLFLTLCSCIGLFVEWRFVLSLDGSYENDCYFMLAPLCVLLFLGIQKIKPTHWTHSVYFKRASTILYVAHGSLLPVISKGVSLLLHIRIPLLSFSLTLFCCIAIYALIEIAIKKGIMPKVLKLLY